MNIAKAVLASNVRKTKNGTIEKYFSKWRMLSWNTSYYCLSEIWKIFLLATKKKAVVIDVLRTDCIIHFFDGFRTMCKQKTETISFPLLPYTDTDSYYQDKRPGREPRKGKFSNEI